MHILARLLIAVSIALATPATAPPPAPDRGLAALEGLAPFSLLLSTPQGRDALAANQRATFDVQRGGDGHADGTPPPLLQPFPQQQHQAIIDAFITAKGGYSLSDGLGSGISRAYRAMVGYASRDDGKTSTATGGLPATQAMLVYAAKISGADSNTAKYFFANGDAAGGAPKCTAPIPAGAAEILTRPGAATDIYGQAYVLPSGGKSPSPAANPCGDSRPFQTDYRLLTYTGNDFWGLRSGNALYLSGPTQDLRTSPSFPSGHTTYGYTEAVLLGILTPRRYAAMVARGAEYGDDRIILGAHYTMDVIAGRTLALYDLAHLLASDSTFQAAVTAARIELRHALSAACRRPGAACMEDTGRFRNARANAAFYESTQTYTLSVVHPETAQGSEDVGTLAPDAGYLLTSAFPALTLKQADDLLTATEGPGGGFLDAGGEFGVFSRIDLYRAVAAAAAQTR